MTIDLDNQSQPELDADILLFEEMSSARVRFFDEIVENLRPDSTVEIRDLRHETVYEIAEFYYLLKIFKINTPQKWRNFAISHNNNIQELLDNKTDQMKLGVHPQRLKESLFDTDEKLDRLMANCGSNGIRLSQSDLARFLVEYMSFETCRTIIKVLGDAGYLRLSKSPFGAILISSTGKLEEIFANHIRSFRLAVNEKLSPATSVLASAGGLGE